VSGPVSSDGGVQTKSPLRFLTAGFNE